MKPFLEVVPPDVVRPGWDGLRTMGFLGRHMRSFDRDKFHWVHKIMTMSAYDFLSEWFETDVLIAALAQVGIIGTMLGIKSPGTAYVLLHYYLGEVDGDTSEWATQVGGTGGVSAAIASSARHFGAEIRCNAPVTQVIIKNGEAVGVALENGDEISARTVVSACDPNMTFRKLVDEKELPPDLVRAIDNFKFRGSSGKVNLALDGLPDFPALKDKSILYGGMPEIAPSCDYLERAYDDAKYDDFSKRPFMGCIIPSTVDPTMAPEGKHSMSIFVQYASYNMPKHGDRDQQREAFGKAVIDTLTDFAPNIKDLILHQRISRQNVKTKGFQFQVGNNFWREGLGFICDGRGPKAREKFFGNSSPTQGILFFQHQHRAPGFGQVGGRCQTIVPTTYYCDVISVRHPFLLFPKHRL